MSVGEQLRKAREARSISLETAAQATHIRVHYLKALEAGDFESLPSATQMRGFLRAYATYLKLDPSAVLSALDGEAPEETPQPVPEAAAPKDWQKSTPADQIFVEIGQRLRAQRELLGLTLEDVERHTHIREHYLKALEAGDLVGLPSPVQGKGMLTNYAHFLGLETESVLLRFADGLQAQLAARQKARPAARRTEGQAVARPALLRRLFSVDLLVVAFLVIFLVAFTAWATLQIYTIRTGAKPTPTGPSIVDVLLPSATLPTEDLLSPTPTVPGQAVTPGSTVSPEPLTTSISETVTLQPGTAAVQAGTAAVLTPVFGASPLQVYVIASERAWMKVTVDDKVVFEGRVLAGSAYPFGGNERIVLETGNGAGLDVIFNQQELGTLGLWGEVVVRIFTLQGVQTPTPAVSPTPTPAPSEAPTPPGTPGSTPTATATTTISP